MDESGCDNIKHIDKNYPVFNLSSVLFKQKNYSQANIEICNIKKDYWGHDKLIFRSRLIRKHKEDFSILFDANIKKKFIASINDFMA